MIFKFIATLSIILSPVAKAFVNAENLTLSESHEDNVGDGFKFVRNFNSQRKKTGLFGVGWCSSFETKLIFSDSERTVVVCGGGHTIKFQKRGTAWVAREPGAKLLEQGHQVIVTLGLRDRYEFGPSGKLMRANVADQDLKFTYQGPKLVQVASKLFKISFTYSGDQITKLTSNHGASLNYDYQKDLLVSVRDGKKKLYHYEYDAARLVKMTSSAESKIWKYDGYKVSSVDSNGCKESLKTKKQGTGQMVKIDMRCGSKPTETREIQIDGHRASQMTVQDRQGPNFQIRQWKNSQLVSEKSPTNSVQYAYDPQGLMKEVTSNKWNLTVINRSSGQPLKVRYTDKGTKMSEILNLRWIGRSLASISSKDDGVQFQTQANKLRLVGKNFDLIAKRSSSGTELSGKIDKRTILPMRSPFPLNKMSPGQLEALSTMKEFEDLKNYLEAL